MLRVKGQSIEKEELYIEPITETADVIHKWRRERKSKGVDRGTHFDGGVKSIVLENNMSDNIAPADVDLDKPMNEFFDNPMDEMVATHIVTNRSGDRFQCYEKKYVNLPDPLYQKEQLPAHMRRTSRRNQTPREQMKPLDAKPNSTKESMNTDWLHSVQPTEKQRLESRKENLRRMIVNRTVGSYKPTNGESKMHMDRMKSSAKENEQVRNTNNGNHKQKLIEHKKRFEKPIIREDRFRQDHKHLFPAEHHYFKHPTESDNTIFEKDEVNRRANTQTNVQHFQKNRHYHDRNQLVDALFVSNNQHQFTGHNHIRKKNDITPSQHTVVLPVANGVERIRRWDPNRQIVENKKADTNDRQTIKHVQPIRTDSVMQPVRIQNRKDVVVNPAENIVRHIDRTIKNPMQNQLTQTKRDPVENEKQKMVVHRNTTVVDQHKKIIGRGDPNLFVNSERQNKIVPNYPSLFELHNTPKPNTKDEIEIDAESIVKHNHRVIHNTHTKNNANREFVSVTEHNHHPVNKQIVNPTYTTNEKRKDAIDLENERLQRLKMANLRQTDFGARVGTKGDVREMDGVHVNRLVVPSSQHRHEHLVPLNRDVSENQSEHMSEIRTNHNPSFSLAEWKAQTDTKPKNENVVVNEIRPIIMNNNHKIQTVRDNTTEFVDADVLKPTTLYHNTNTKVNVLQDKEEQIGEQIQFKITPRGSYNTVNQPFNTSRDTVAHRSDVVMMKGDKTRPYKSILRTPVGRAPVKHTSVREIDNELPSAIENRLLKSPQVIRTPKKKNDWRTMSDLTMI
jgi:hypothetical protein